MDINRDPVDTQPSNSTKEATAAPKEGGKPPIRLTTFARLTDNAGAPPPAAPREKEPQPRGGPPKENRHTRPQEAAKSTAGPRGSPAGGPPHAATGGPRGSPAGGPPQAATGNNAQLEYTPQEEAILKSLGGKSEALCVIFKHLKLKSAGTSN